jgi:hypothetical protein
MTDRLRDRSTADLIVLFLAGLIAVIILTTLIGGIVWKANDPAADLSGLIERVSELTNTLVGAVVGYIAGKGAASTVRDRPTERGGP